MSAKLKFSLKIISVIFIIIVGGYYIMKLRSGGKKAVAFVSLTYKWGTGDTLLNSYNSRTGDYKFLNQRDQLIKENFKLRTNSIIYLHSKINEHNLLTIPDTIANKNANFRDSTVLRHEITLVYDDETRHIVFLSNYDGDPMILNKAMALQKYVQQIILEAEERFVRK